MLFELESLTIQNAYTSFLTLVLLALKICRYRKSQLHWFKSSCISFLAIVSKLWRLQLRGAICKNSGSKREAYCIHGEKRIWITFQFKIVDLGQILGLLCNSVLKELPGRVLQKFVSQNKLATLYTNQWLRLISIKLIFLTPPYYWLKVILIVLELI